MERLIDKLKWLWGGRRYGNEIADALHIPRSLFHRALDLGGMPMHLIVLAEIRRKGISVAEAKCLLAPIVIAGIIAMLSRFGAEQNFVAAHSRLVHQFPNGGNRDSYSQAFQQLDALVKN